MNEVLVKVPVTVIMRVPNSAAIDTAITLVEELLATDTGTTLDWTVDHDRARVVPGEPAGYRRGDAV